MDEIPNPSGVWPDRVSESLINWAWEKWKTEAPTSSESFTHSDIIILNIYLYLGGYFFSSTEPFLPSHIQEAPKISPVDSPLPLASVYFFA